MDLQHWFYVLGIVFMIVNLLIIVGIFMAILVIKAKIDHMHQIIEEKINKVKDITDRGATILRTAKHFMGR